MIYIYIYIGDKGKKRIGKGRCKPGMRWCVYGWRLLTRTPPISFRLHAASQRRPAANDCCKATGGRWRLLLLRCNFSYWWCCLICDTCRAVVSADGRQRAAGLRLAASGWHLGWWGTLAVVYHHTLLSFLPPPLLLIAATCSIFPCQVSKANTILPLYIKS